MNVKNKFKRIKSILIYMFQLKKSKYILMDTPLHGNIGDQAIAVAEKQLLKKHNIKYLEIDSMEMGGHERIYAFLTPPSQEILVHGGGFLGILWQDEEERFRRILMAFHKNRIVVFPQTVTFDVNTDDGQAFLEESKKIYSSHPDLLIYVREKKSYEFMRKYIPDVKVKLVPDMVMGLDIPLKNIQRKDILVCMRADKEKAISKENQDSIMAILRRNYPECKLDFTDTVVNHNIFPDDRETKVQAKLNQFATHKLVVTDRLHGMIFSVITNTPCIAFGNINGKVKDVYETWFQDIDYIKYAQDISSFVEIINTLDINQEYTYSFKTLNGILDEICKGI